MIKTPSAVIGHNVNIEEFSRLGLISGHEFVGLGMLGIAEEHNLSDVFQTDNQSYDEYEFDSNYELYYGDDEVSDFENGRIIQEIAPNNAYDRVELSADWDGIYKILLGSLGPTEKKVIIARYGLDGNNPQTLDEIGRVLNISSSWVRHIEAKSLVKMRKPIKLAQNHDLFECLGVGNVAKRFG